MKSLSKILSPLLIAFLVLGSLQAVAAPQPAPTTALVSTQDALQANQVSADRERISEVLARQEVQEQLLAQGVDPADIEARVAALSDEEVRQMADHLDQLPAGASVVGAVVFIFVLLLITDILGLTNVFPFTR
ncbi:MULTISPECIES: PA2779 family protein [Halomonadaceae]|uniref:PA2779 family protein n=1 Tax=Halomonadaceae TaxID=28256 RepID=UPI0015981347|nr:MULTISPECIES: PA2779 family protein [Halomonas]QJQ93992.1 PA2779 family protein [Halomonas sp. PA5]